MSEQEIHFVGWLRGATRAAIFVVRYRVYRARKEAPSVRREANRLIRAITQELAARGEYDTRRRQAV
jgi:hypothetical protein